MNKSLWRRWRDFWRAEFLSPKDLVQRAAVFCVAFAIAHLLGWRDFTSFVNGTTGSVEMSFEQAAARGVVYLILYLAVVVLVPIFLIAAAISKLLLKRFPDRQQTNPPEPD